MEAKVIFKRDVGSLRELQEAQTRMENPISKSVDATGKQAGWVLRNKATGEAIYETYDPKKVATLNTEKYEAVPIGEYLASLNKSQAASTRERMSQ
jgi:hypothetical protein